MRELQEIWVTFGHSERYQRSGLFWQVLGRIWDRCRRPLTVPHHRDLSGHPRSPDPIAGFHNARAIPERGSRAQSAKETSRSDVCVPGCPHLIDRRHVWFSARDPKGTRYRPRSSQTIIHPQGGVPPLLARACCRSVVPALIEKLGRTFWPRRVTPRLHHGSSSPEGASRGLRGGRTGITRKRA